MSQPTAETVISEIIRREGGDQFTNRPSDKGGPTKFGITAETLGEYRKLHRPATAQEVSELEEREARDIYAWRYIGPWYFAPLPLRDLLIDWGVTTSHPRVIRTLQAALAELGYYTDVDGVVGPLTMDAVRRVEVDGKLAQLYKLVLARRIQFYVGLGFDDTTRKFLKANPRAQLHNVPGWVNRCLEFL